jgi:NitT/TauT family transport system permease protein
VTGRARRWGRGLVGVLCLFALLEVLTRAGLVSPRYLPPASSILGRTAAILVDADFLANVGGTLLAWAAGLLLAVVVAVPLGLLLGSSATAHAASRAFVELLRPVPSVALIPLAILLFGRGTEMKVALILYASVWPILINTVSGVHDVDPVAVDTARSFGLRGRALLLRVTLPSAAPFVFTGVRVAAAIALILAVSTELLAGGGRGIGTWMLERSLAGSAQASVYAGTIVAGLLGLLVNVVFVAWERRLFAWHGGSREPAA